MPGLYCGQLFIEKTGKLETMAKSAKQLLLSEEKSSQNLSCQKQKSNAGFPSLYQFDSSISQFQK